MPKTQKKARGKKETSESNNQLNKILIENFVNLQKVLTNLAIKFENLSENISKLLQLFEISAKSFAEKQKEMPSPLMLERKISAQNREFIEKIDKLLEQNKIIAKGLTILEEKISARERREIKEGAKHEFTREDEFPHRLPRI